MNLLTIRNGILPYVVQNERYASSGVSVLISFAIVSIVTVNSPSIAFLLLFSHIGKEKWLPDSSLMATTWQK